MSALAEPIARHASAGSYAGHVKSPLRHPTPDLQSLQGAYRHNIVRLERSAAEMSEGGSDIGEEIRKLNELSRQNSIQSSNHGDISVIRPSVMERMSSTRSSRASSYGRANAPTRWGGYSPTGNVASPVEPMSPQWPLSRVASGKSSKLAQVSEPMHEGRPLDSPLRPTFGMDEPGQVEEPRSREVSDSSFSRHYDEIANQIQESLQHVPPSPQKHIHPDRRHESVHLELEGGDTPDRRQSTDTFQEAQLAFQDFDGVHFSPDTEEFVELDEAGHEVRRVSARSTGNLSIQAASMLRAPRPISQVPAPPDEGMVYYPAPVPKMLSMPKRLSQLPAASVQSKRRTQMLSGLPPEAKAAAPWLAQETLDENAQPRHVSHHSRRSGSSGTVQNQSQRASMENSSLPAYVRATMYFEHQPVQQDVQIKAQSAVATLESLLAASVAAPVHAFTDHPYVGDVRKTVYSAEFAERKSGSAHSSPKVEKTKKRRSSSFGKLLERTASDDELGGKLRKKGSKTSLLTDLDTTGEPKKLKKRQSMMSMGSFGDELERPTTARLMTDEPDLQTGLVAAAQNASPPQVERRVSFGPSTVMSNARDLDEDELIEEDFKEEEANDEVEDPDATFVQPSTLLAELQIRKAQQKSRSKTAATHFPQGMHSTLLQLDAVEEISKRKRQHQRIALAWEDPHQRALDEDKDKDDEEVPLGMLYPSKDGRTHRNVGDGKDLSRPLGLMEKRTLEDNEPLSSRRNRLRGVSATIGTMPGALGATPNGSQVNLAGQPNGAGEGETVDESEGETLAQRMKRMKSKDALDKAISDITPKDGERPDSTFADDLLGQFGSLEVKDKDADAAGGNEIKPSVSPGPEEEETLGQRRARLQREREANGEQREVSGGSARPVLRSSNSLANLLAANPVGQRQSSKTYVPTQGTLLHANARDEERHRSQLLNTNMRSSSYGMDKPLIDPRIQNNRQPQLNGMMAQGPNRAPVGGFAAGMYNNGMGGIQLPASASTPMFGMNGGNAYFHSPSTGVPYAGYGYGYPQQQMNPLAFGGVNTGTMGTGFLGNAYLPGMNNMNNFMGSSTYAAFAQNMAGQGMPMGMPMGMGMGDEPLNNAQRTAIDQWRMGIGPMP